MGSLYIGFWFLNFCFSNSMSYLQIAKLLTSQILLKSFTWFLSIMAFYVGKTFIEWKIDPDVIIEEWMLDGPQSFNCPLCSGPTLGHGLSHGSGFSFPLGVWFWGLPLACSASGHLGNDSVQPSTHPTPGSWALSPAWDHKVHDGSFSPSVASRPFH